MASGGSGGGRTGIEVSVTANLGEIITLQRDTSGGFGSAVTISSWYAAGGAESYTDNLPLDGVSYYYRAKVSRSGFVDSSYSGSINAKPTTLSGLA